VAGAELAHKSLCCVQMSASLTRQVRTYGGTQVMYIEALPRDMSSYLGGGEKVVTVRMPVTAGRDVEYLQ